jgi:hypothetical protein
MVCGLHFMLCVLQFMLYVLQFLPCVSQFMVCGMQFMLYVLQFCIISCNVVSNDMNINKIKTLTFKKQKMSREYSRFHNETDNDGRFWQSKLYNDIEKDQISAQKETNKWLKSVSNTQNQQTELNKWNNPSFNQNSFGYSRFGDQNKSGSQWNNTQFTNEINKTQNKDAKFWPKNNETDKTPLFSTKSISRFV